MAVLLGGHDREVEGHRTRIFAEFFTQLPPDVQQEAVEVEQRWRRITGNNQDGDSGNNERSNFITDVLENVDADLRNDILLTCNLSDLEGHPALLAEAAVLRDLRRIHAVGDSSERADARRQRNQRRRDEVVPVPGGRRGAEVHGVASSRAEWRGMSAFPEELHVEGGHVSEQASQVTDLYSLLVRLSTDADPNHSDNARETASVTRSDEEITHSSGNFTALRRLPRVSTRITEAQITSRIRAQQSRSSRDENVPPPPGCQGSAAGPVSATLTIPSQMLKQLVQLIRFSRGMQTSLDRSSTPLGDLSVGSQLVQLLVTACKDTASATEAMLYLIDVGMEGTSPTVTNTGSAALDQVGEASRIAGGPSVENSCGRIVLQVILVISKLIDRCRAAGMSFTTLPDGVNTSTALKPVNEPLNVQEQEAVDKCLFRRIVELVLRAPSPRVEASFARLVRLLNEQLRDLENEDTGRGNQTEEDHTPLSSTVILHPRHPHRLYWQNVYRYPYSESGYGCNRCHTAYYADSYAFHCEMCRYDLCPDCGLVYVTAQEEKLRGRRWGYALVHSEGTMESALRLLCSPNCTSSMAQQVVEFLRRGINESARRDSVTLGESDNSPIVMVERVIIDFARNVTVEIRTCINKLRTTFPNKIMSPSSLGALSPSLGGLVDQTNMHVDDTARQHEWSPQEANIALSCMNMVSTANQSHALFLPYAESHRPEPREVSLMWHAIQIYLAEITSILQHMQNRSSVILPHSVLLLLNIFCQFHMAEPRRAASSESIVMESSGAVSIEKTETERFMLDTTQTPSIVSDNADRAVAEAKKNEQAQPAASAQSVVAPALGTTTGSEAVVDERSSIPRVVRQFVECNKLTINALVQYDSKLLEENFKFLKTEPGFVDFNVRLLDFQRHINYATQGPRISLSINRDQCLRDSFAQLSKLKTFHGSINVRFRGEEGADVGGLTREWFQLLAEEMVNDNYALFVHSREGMYQPNPFSDVNPNHLQYFKFAGTVVGMAVAHRVAIDVHFTRAVYRHMTGVQPIFRDLESVDPELYENLEWLLKNDVSDLGLFFTVSCERFGVIQETELLPNGSQIAVTNSNKSKYVRLRCEFHMTRQIEQQMEEFLKGFYTVIPRKEIRNFTAQEMELVICGMPDIDVEDLRMHTVYEGYTATSLQIRWFWEVVAAMTKEDRANLLQFATGASKVPHGGFSNLESVNGSSQRFTITRWDDNTDLLPQAHTCFNKIVLPEYSSREELRKKLMVAITFGSRGFTML
ncbi:protein of unknown function (DUF4414) HECT domain [Trypanosoma vivax]|nr:protein of unknown function (DUF4414) HECT domain [Trypanosoma vivax]